MSERIGRKNASTGTPPRLATCFELLVKAREIYSGAKIEPVLFYCLISASDDDPVEPDPYAAAMELLETIIGEPVQDWDGTREAGLEYLDMAIELARGGNDVSEK